MLWMLIGLMVLILLALLRAVLGPTVIDRFISINAITGKISVIILLIAFIREEYGFVDISIVFMLCGFIGGIWILRALTPGDWTLKIPGEKDLEAEDKNEDGVVPSD